MTQQPPPSEPQKRKRPLWQWIIGVAVALFVGIDVAGLPPPPTRNLDADHVTLLVTLASDGKATIVVATKPPTSVSIKRLPTEPPTHPPSIAPSYGEIADPYFPLTDAQWQARNSTLVGYLVNGWIGTIIDISPEASNDKYIIQVDFDGHLDTTEAQVEVTKDQVSKISKGQTITFFGIIQKITGTQGACLVEITSSTIKVK